MAEVQKTTPGRALDRPGAALRQLRDSSRAHYRFCPIGAKPVVSVRRGPGEKDQTELAN
jgi:hypothetical protein